MKEWVIILVIHFADAGRIDEIVTDLTFSDPIACHEFRLSEEFQKELILQYKNHKPPVKYVRPFCRHNQQYKKEELFACSKCVVEWKVHVRDNSTKGICSISPCLW
tara:strand:- start:94 stop:411 length:318 start_codon:yes stop_codon:yes gene_type:complete